MSLSLNFRLDQVPGQPRPRLSPAWSTEGGGFSPTVNSGNRLFLALLLLLAPISIACHDNVDNDNVIPILYLLWQFHCLLFNHNKKLARAGGIATDDAITISWHYGCDEPHNTIVRPRYSEMRRWIILALFFWNWSIIIILLLYSSTVKRFYREH